MNREKLSLLAKDLTKEYPRSPRETLGGYVIAARSVDKCRAALLGINGEYNYYPCSLASHLFDFTGITQEKFKEFVATGATDDEIAEWLKSKSRVQDKMEIIRWNYRLRDMRISEMPDGAQEYLEEYVEESVPKHRPVYVWFDVYDLEEERL